MRTYEELRAAAVETGYDPNEAVTRARIFAACMIEASTGEAVKMVAARMAQGLPIGIGDGFNQETAAGTEEVLM